MIYFIEKLTRVEFYQPISARYNNLSIFNRPTACTKTMHENITTEKNKERQKKSLFEMLKNNLKY